MPFAHQGRKPNCPPHHIACYSELLREHLGELQSSFLTQLRAPSSFRTATRAPRPGCVSWEEFYTSSKAERPVRTNVEALTLRTRWLYQGRRKAAWQGASTSKRLGKGHSEAGGLMCQPIPPAHGSRGQGHGSMDLKHELQADNPVFGEPRRSHIHSEPQCPQL